MCRLIWVVDEGTFEKMRFLTLRPSNILILVLLIDNVISIKTQPFILYSHYVKQNKQAIKALTALVGRLSLSLGW